MLKQIAFVNQNENKKEKVSIQIENNIERVNIMITKL